MPSGATRSTSSGLADARVELGRAQVDVVLQGEPDRQQHAALEDAARDARVADGAEQDRVVALQLVQDAVGQRLAGGVPAAGAEVVLGRGDLRAARRRDGLEDLEPLGDDLGADPVAADDGEVEGVGHRVLGVWACVQPRRSCGAARRLT